MDMTRFSYFISSTLIRIVVSMRRIDLHRSTWQLARVYSMASSLWMLYAHAPCRSRLQPPLRECSTHMVNRQPLSPPLKPWRRAQRYSLTSEYFPIRILQFSPKFQWKSGWKLRELLQEHLICVGPTQYSTCLTGYWIK